MWEADLCQQVAQTQSIHQQMKAPSPSPSVCQVAAYSYSYNLYSGESAVSLLFNAQPKTTSITKGAIWTNPGQNSPLPIEY